MDIGLKGMGRKKDYYSTDKIVIPVTNIHSLKSTINMIGKILRERIKEIEDNSGLFIKDMIAKDRFEIYLKLLKIDKREEITNFVYQINTIVREPRKV